MGEPMKECPREQTDWNKLRAELAALQAQGNDAEIKKRIDKLVDCGQLKKVTVYAGRPTGETNPDAVGHEGDYVINRLVYRTADGEDIAGSYAWNKNPDPPKYTIYLFDKSYFAKKILESDAETLSKKMDLYALYKRLQAEVDKTVDWKKHHTYDKLPFGMGMVSSDTTYFMLGEYEDVVSPGGIKDVRALNEEDDIWVPVPQTVKSESVRIGGGEIIFGLDPRIGRVTPYKYSGSPGGASFDENGFANDLNKVPLTLDELEQACKAMYERIKKLQRSQACAESRLSRKCILGP